MIDIRFWEALTSNEFVECCPNVVVSYYDTKSIEFKAIPLSIVLRDTGYTPVADLFWKGISLEYRDVQKREALKVVHWMQEQAAMIKTCADINEEKAKQILLLDMKQQVSAWLASR